MNDIFLIDDDSLVNFLNKEIIKESFPQKNVTAFENASDAINALKELATNPEKSIPQVILLDINMPIMDGWDFLDQFKDLSKEILASCRVIMHTSSIDPRDIEKAKTYTMVTDFISKPLTEQFLRQIFLR